MGSNISVRFPDSEHVVNANHYHFTILKQLRETLFLRVIGEHTIVHGTTKQLLARGVEGAHALHVHGHGAR